MLKQKLFRLPARYAVASIVATITLACLLLSAQTPRAEAANWNQIEPLKSRLDDVERLLGKPLEEKGNEPDSLRFKVNGGMVTISFVSAKFVATKKLSPAYEGTVLQVVLQHEHAPDTPDSMKLVKNSAFQLEQRQGVAHYRNLKDGIAYTFVDGKLKTTWYSPSAELLARARMKG
jgi:hypothetical protein